MVYGQPALTKYPPEVRKFAYILNHHSPASYNIVRAQFSNCLPHPRTLTEWLSVSDINGEHGFNENTMKRLVGFVNDLKDSKGEELICTLMFDEMFIKKQVYWDQSKFEYVGYPTYKSNEPNRKKLPNEQDENTTSATKADRVEKTKSSMRRVTRSASNQMTVAEANEQDQDERYGMSTKGNKTGAESGKKERRALLLLERLCSCYLESIRVLNFQSAIIF